MDTAFRIPVVAVKWERGIVVQIGNGLYLLIYFKNIKSGCLEPQEEVSGRDLVPLIERRQAEPNRDYYSETCLPYYTYGWAKLRVLRRGAWKLIDHLGSGGFSSPRRVEGDGGQLFGPHHVKAGPFNGVRKDQLRPFVISVISGIKGGVDRLF